MPHEKLTFGSVRESLGLVRSALSNYSALRPFAAWASACRAPGPAPPARISKRPSKAANGRYQRYRGFSMLVMFALLVSPVL